MTKIGGRRAINSRGYTFIQTYPRSGYISDSENLVAMLSDFYNPELLTPNQQTGTDTLGNTTGFTTIGGSTINSSTEQAHTGTRSLKVTTPGTKTIEGAKTTSVTTEASTTYTASAWVYAPAGATLLIALTDDIDTSAIKNFTGTGTWKYVTINMTTDTHTLINLVVRNTGTAQAITYYVDDLSLKKTETVPLSGKTVQFTVNGTNAGTATTNASGIATLPYTITQSTGTYVIQAIFAGDANYTESVGVSTLTVI